METKIMNLYLSETGLHFNQFMNDMFTIEIQPAGPGIPFTLGVLLDDSVKIRLLLGSLNSVQSVSLAKRDLDLVTCTFSSTETSGEIGGVLLSNLSEKPFKTKTSCKV